MILPPPTRAEVAPRRSAFASAVRLLRPKQWTKGLLVYAGLLFTRSYLNPVLTLRATVALFAIVLASSAVYVANDLLDVERDRAHPVKRRRPLAAGEIAPAAAFAILLVCLVASLALAATLGASSVALVVAYLLLMAVYIFGLKRAPVADVFCVALGFVLRAALGAAAIGVAISAWLLYCTGALALLLGFGKRRHEFVLQGERRAESRESLVGYTRPALDAMVLIAAATAAMSYGLYSVESPTAARYPALIVTSLFVFYGIYRYVLLILARDEGGEPETLMLRDRHLVLSVLLFVLSAIVALNVPSIPFLEGAR